MYKWNHLFKVRKHLFTISVEKCCISIIFWSKEYDLCGFNEHVLTLDIRIHRGGYRRFKWVVMTGGIVCERCPLPQTQSSLC